MNTADGQTNQNPMGGEASKPEKGNDSRWTPSVKVIVGVTVLVLVGLAFVLFRVVFVPLIIGAVMAYVFNPLVTRIQKATRLPRGLATGLLYLILLVLLIPIATSLVPFAVRQANYLQSIFIDFIKYMESIAPGTRATVLGFDFEVRAVIDEITLSLTKLVTSAAPESLTFVLGAARTSLLVIFTFVIGFYLTRDAEQVTNWMRDLIPPGHRTDTEKLLTEIDVVWTAFLRGQLLLALVVTVILTVVSAILGLPRPLLLGIWGGLLEFLPSIGNMIWGATAVTVAILHGSSYLPLPNGLFAILVFGVYIAFAQIEINVLMPYIIGNRVRLHPLVVIVGVIVGASVGGILGVALAAPIIASLRVVFRYIYAKLFDLDPFPMVGAPSAPVEIRESEAQRQAAEAPITNPLPRVVAEKIRRPRKDETVSKPEESQGR